jgi:hypothetical protein
MLSEAAAIGCYAFTGFKAWRVLALTIGSAQILRVLPFFPEQHWFQRQVETSAFNIPAETDAYDLHVDLGMMPITF